MFAYLPTLFFALELLCCLVVWHTKSKFWEPIIIIFVNNVKTSVLAFFLLLSLKLKLTFAFSPKVLCQMIVSFHIVKIWFGIYSLKGVWTIHFNTLGLYRYTLVIGHTFWNMLKIQNELKLKIAKGIAKLHANNVFSDQK